MKKKLCGFLGRFVTIHVITYLLIGITCMLLQNYSEALDTMEAFRLYRDLEQPLMAGLLIPTQIIRGAILGLFLYPFYSKYIGQKKGWLKLFLLLYGLTFAVMAIPGIFVDLYNTVIGSLSFQELIFGTLEVTVQMLIFSFIFFKWENIKYNKAS